MVSDKRKMKLDYCNMMTIDKKTACNIALNFVSPVTLGDRDMAVFDVESLNKAWAVSPFYIKSDGLGHTALRAMNFMLSERTVKTAPKCELFRDNKKRVVLYFHDGRHRFAILRDSGADQIRVAMPKKSLKLAQKMGMIIADYEKAVPMPVRKTANTTSYFDELSKRIKKLPRKEPWSLLREELRLVEEHVSMKPNASGCWVRKQYDRLNKQYNNLVLKHGNPDGKE